MFSQWNFASSIGQFFGSAVTYTLQKSEELPLACLFEVFTGLWLSTPTFCMKDYDYVKRFVCVLVLLVINTGCLKKLLKMGNTTLLISSSNYAKRQLNVCSGGDLCSPFFSNFSETSCMKVGFDQSALKHGRRTFLSERFKTWAAHFLIQRDGRTGMQRAALGKSGSEEA